jgi:4-hydroxyphenylpyruvate dioxygenase-like putative hemolysin
MSRRRQRYPELFPPVDPYFGYGSPLDEIPETIQKYQYLESYFKQKQEELKKLLEEAGKKEKEKAQKGRSFTALEQFQMILIASAALGFIWYKILA